TYHPEVQNMIETRLQEVCSGVALGLGAAAHVHYERIYPATINSRDEARFAADVAQKLVGHEHVDRNMDPSMGAEDFSFMLQVKPGAYLRLGQGAENGVGSCFLHNSRYDFNDDVLPLGAALHAGLVEQGMPLAEPAHTASAKPISAIPTPVRSDA
ncbi:M20/M25/M40 family metallo-hydrolase, partial [Hydrogenophaga sp.]|uniref:M20/M25/M40 family metallo-hydrolase n=1 Tax=Hydrogenophaga sp. TaxID=1904254 RepID=UPI003D147841